MHDFYIKYPILESLKEKIESAINFIISSYDNDGKLLLCGNGGSACDCDHMSGELLKGFYSKRKLSKEDIRVLGDGFCDNLQGSLPAIPLSLFHGAATAFANDCDKDYFYAQLIWGLGKKEDIVFGILTSGNSNNVVLAMKLAQKMGIKTIGLTGEVGGSMNEYADCLINVPEMQTHKIQELHLPVYHYICLKLEEYYFN